MRNEMLVGLRKSPIMEIHGQFTYMPLARSVATKKAAVNHGVQTYQEAAANSGRRPLTEIRPGFAEKPVLGMLTLHFGHLPSRREALENNAKQARRKFSAVRVNAVRIPVGMPAAKAPGLALTRNSPI
jgi:hypothetical protein